MTEDYRIQLDEFDLGLNRIDQMIEKNILKKWMIIKSLMLNDYVTDILDYRIY